MRLFVSFEEAIEKIIRIHSSLQNFGLEIHCDGLLTLALLSVYTGVVQEEFPQPIPSALLFFLRMIGKIGDLANYSYEGVQELIGSDDTLMGLPIRCWDNAAIKRIRAVVFQNAEPVLEGSIEKRCAAGFGYLGDLYTESG